MEVLARTHGIRIHTILLSQGIVSSDYTPIEQLFLSAPTRTVSGAGWQRIVRHCSTLPSLWVQVVQFSTSQSVSYFYSPFLKVSMRIFSFGLQAGVTYIKDVACMSKFYELRKTARSD